MASFHSLEKCFITSRISSAWHGSVEATGRTKQLVVLPVPMIISRRSAILISLLPPLNLTLPIHPLLARERRTKKAIPLEDYLTSCQSFLVHLSVVLFHLFLLISVYTTE